MLTLRTGADPLVASSWTKVSLWILHLLAVGIADHQLASSHKFSELQSRIYTQQRSASVRAGTSVSHRPKSLIKTPALTGDHL